MLLKEQTVPKFLLKLIFQFSCARGVWSTFSLAFLPVQLRPCVDIPFRIPSMGGIDLIKITHLRLNVMKQKKKTFKKQLHKNMINPRLIDMPLNPINQ